MRRTIKERAALTCALCLCLAEAAQGAQYLWGPRPEVLQQQNYGLPGGTAIAAYQQPYAMNFEIWKPAGLPSGWYATFDGFPVAQVGENRWVYGRIGVEGTLIPTDVLVGSVIPMEVPSLVRIASDWRYSDNSINTAEFKKLLKFHCDTMGYLDDPLMSTAVAWNSQKPDAWVWLGKRWRKVTNRPGEYTWQALNRSRPWLIKELRKNGRGVDPVVLADLARQWGLLWVGRFSPNDLSYYHERSGGDANHRAEGTPTSVGPAPSGGGGSNWDVD